MATKPRINARLLALAGCAAIGLSAPAARAAGPSCLNLPPAKVGMQLYSVYGVVAGPPQRPAPGQPFTPPKASTEQLAGLFGELHKMGWRNVENFAGAWGLSQDDYVKAVKASGLQMVSSHDNLDMAQWNATLDRAVALGQTYVGSGGYGKIDTLEHTLQSAADLNAFGEAAAKRGLKFFVHSHEAEIKTRFDVDLKGDGKVQSMNVFDIVAAKTDPRYVNFEVDVGWADAAFGLNLDDTLAFLTSHRSRVVMLHIKDMSPDSKPTDMGQGVIDYGRVIQAAGPQIAYYIWEYDRPPMPLDSARIAFPHMVCKAP